MVDIYEIAKGEVETGALVVSVRAFMKILLEFAPAKGKFPPPVLC